MSEVLIVSNDSSKEEKYKILRPQLEALLSGESDLIANMANTTAALMQTFVFLWVGFYIIREDKLVLGPFQGKIACTRIPYGKGVCGKSWSDEQTLIVGDVDLFPGHISCDGDSRSEIVVPFYLNNKLSGVLDIDSDKLNCFDEVDKLYLEEIVTFLSKKMTYS